MTCTQNRIGYPKKLVAFSEKLIGFSEKLVACSQKRVANLSFSLLKSTSTVGSTFFLLYISFYTENLCIFVSSYMLRIRMPSSLSNRHTSSTRFEWVAIAQAMAIVLVVMFHVRLLNLDEGSNYEFIDQICGFLLHIHMPVFFLLSGFLLYHTRISIGSNPISVYRNKIIKLGIPFVFCTCLGNLAQIVFNGFVKHPHAVTPLSFLQSFFIADGYPWPHRWFLMALILMMVLYPLYKYILKNSIVEIVTLLLLVGLSYVPFEIKNNLFALIQFKAYLPFFFLGMLVCKYRLWTFLDKLWMPAALWIVTIIIYITPDLWTIVARHYVIVFKTLCACALISTALQIAKHHSPALSSLSAYIFPIYMFGVAFQAFIELIVWRAIGCPDNLVIIFYILNVIVGIALPVLICKLMLRLPLRLLHRCLGLSV